MRLDGKASTRLTPALLTGYPVPGYTTPTTALNGWHGTSSLGDGLSVELEVRGPRHDLHSANFGGAVHNPLQALCEIIAKMHDANGRVSIPGFYDRVRRFGALGARLYAKGSDRRTKKFSPTPRTAGPRCRDSGDVIPK